MIRIAWVFLCLTSTCPSWGQQSQGQQSQGPESLPPYSASSSLREDATLRSVAFVTAETGLACGDRGTILRTVDGGASWQLINSGVDCPLSAVVWIDTNNAVVAGGNYDRITGISRGAVLLSEDGGESWQRADDKELTRIHKLEQSSEGFILASCDWSHTVLTNRLISRDGGRTWNDHSTDNRTASTVTAHPQTTTKSPSLNELMQWFQATKVPVAIRGACRINRTDYCTVGDHGMILLTRDQGKTWVATRGKKRRTSVLFVADSAKTAAWSMLGSEALESRNRVSLLVRETLNESTAGSPDHVLANQIAIMLGGSGADTIGQWGDDINQTALAWLGIHRPTVLVLDETLPTALSEAFVNAAASTGIQRIAVHGFNGNGGTSLHRDALLSHSGTLAGDLHVDAMHYLSPNDIQIKSTTLRYPYDISPNQRRGSSVTNGLTLPMGHRLAGKVNDASRRQLQILKARLQQTDRLQQLVKESNDTAKFNESIKRVLDQTAKVDQFRVAWSIVQATHPSKFRNRLALHEVALEQFASRFPNSSAGSWAALRKQAILRSDEWKLIRSALIKPYGAANNIALNPAVPVSPFQVTDGNIRQVSNASPLVVPQPEQYQITKSPRLVDRNVNVDLLWEFHPMVLFAQEAARERGDHEGLQVANEFSPNLQRLADSRPNPWSRLLPKGSGTPVAHRASFPPKLDGLLTDECWESATPFDHSSVRTRIAYDEDYIYFAMQTPASNLKADTSDSTFPESNRDHDLSMSDRIQLRIDTDRDLLTAMELQISGSGRTHDAIDGNPRWQPTWYLDTYRETALVTIEMAIERRDITELPVTPGASWFISPRVLTSGGSSSATVIPDPQQWVRVLFQ
ncbi:MAG: hypothetical protein CMM01_07935 [Rhodopirellula sp.]|nr:hypothetical protein [Rhodopirellula sp.]OUX51634.1 MAG: hypothetical protein CBE43_02900 [Rhodopirellula sp. TMED283]